MKREHEGDVAGAEKLYVNALKLDARNRAARVSLAGLLLSGPESSHGLQQLERAMADAEESEGGADAVYYAGALRQIATLYNLRRTSDALGAAERLLSRIDSKVRDIATLRDIDDATQTLLRFFRLTKLADRRVATRHDAARDAALEAYLKSLRPAVIAIVAGLRTATGDVAAMSLLSAIDTTVPSGFVQYNIACTYSVAAAHTERADYARMALSHLAFALRLQPRPAEMICGDHSLAYLSEHFTDEFLGIVARHASRRPPG